MNTPTTGIAKQRQDPLRERYRTAPKEAWIVDGAGTIANGAEDPFHCAVAPGQGYGESWQIGIHRAVGGYHDHPNPGDLLCAALASCLHSTIRIIADRLEISIARLEVSARAGVRRPRHPARRSRSSGGVPENDLEVRVETAMNVPVEKMKLLLAAAEHSCIVFQTLRSGVQVQTQFDETQSLADLAVQ